MHRRDFLASAAAGAAWAALAAAAAAADGLRVTRAVGFQLTSRRAKVAGKNARLDVHGDRGGDRMLRLFTNQGVEGLGNCRAAEADVARLLGTNPLALHDPAARRMAGPLGAGSMPLWDLAGKLLDKPVYALLGGQGVEHPPVYDGSIYFADLLPQYAARWQDRFREEIDMGLAAGHRAFKIKIGRGHKWMPRAEGDARDVAVVQLIRRHAGPDVRLFVDANNGYDLAGAQRLLEHIGPENIGFVEELFPETVEECLALKEFIRAHGWQTLVADGETQRELEAYRPFIAAQAIDLLQGDMNHFGLEGILTEAQWARSQGIRVAPHNWGSLVGYIMQVHIGRALENFFAAEQDPLSTEVLRTEGYAIREGLATVPDAPGFGWALDEARFASEARVLFDLKA